MTVAGIMPLISNCTEDDHDMTVRRLSIVGEDLVIKMIDSLLTLSTHEVMRPALSYFTLKYASINFSYPLHIYECLPIVYLTIEKGQLHRVGYLNLFPSM